MVKTRNIGSKRHHYVPRMIQKRFADHDGTLFFVRKSGNNPEIKRTSPQNLFVEKHLNATFSEHGTRSTETEEYLSELESGADPIIEKIVQTARSGTLPQLSKSEKSVLDTFVYKQWARVSSDQVGDFFDPEELLDDLIRQYQSEFGSLSAAEAQFVEKPQWRTRLMHNSRVRALRLPSNEAIDVLRMRGLGIARISNERRGFIVGSRPIVKFCGKNSHVLEPTTELWFPITHDVVITPFGHSGDERLVDCENEYQIRRINEEIFAQSHTAASRSRKLLESLLRVEQSRARKQ